MNGSKDLIGTLHLLVHIVPLGFVVEQDLRPVV